MKIDAGSFGGRVLAVVSRRSPAFRPPHGRQSGGPFLQEGARSEEISGQDYSEYLRENRYSIDRNFDRNLAPGGNDVERVELRHVYRMLNMKVGEFRRHLLLAHSHFESRSSGFGSSRKRARAASDAVDELVEASQACEEMGAFLVADTRNARLSAAATARLMAHNTRVLALACCSLIASPRSSTDWADAQGRIYTLLLLAERAEKRTNLAANDFTSADLSSAQLDGIDLTDLKWSGSTIWPPGWSERLRRASKESEPGVFVVSADGRGSTSHLEEV
ncbi:hypothetical protein QFZ55_002684 [Streptomyces luteogriseus]|nr:hypothetical protein [Streptomyces luteogriseus]